MSEDHTDITPEQSFFAVFCIEALADELGIRGDAVYKLLTEDSNLLDSYIFPNYETLHTQGRNWIINDLRELMIKEGLIK